MKTKIYDMLYFIGSIIILLALWQVVTIVTKNEIPSPFKTLAVFGEMLKNPFYDNGPNDKGFGVQLI